MYLLVIHVISSTVPYCVKILSKVYDRKCRDLQDTWSNWMITVNGNTKRDRVGVGTKNGEWRIRRIITL